MAAKKSKPRTTKIGDPKGITAGRNKGSKNRSTLVKEALKGGWDDLMLTDAQKVFSKAVEMAVEGDTACIKMILDRAVPVTKAVDINANDLSGKGGVTIHIEQLVATPKPHDPIDIEDAVIVDS